MKYLVTGGLGVIGSRFVEKVIEDGHEALVMDAAEEPRNLWMEEILNRKYGDKVQIFKRRIENTLLKPYLEDVDFILHAAAHTGIPHSEQDPSDDWVSNVDATRHILEALRKWYPKIPTVMLSSVKPYRVHDLPQHAEGDRMILDEPPTCIDESCLLEPDEPYAASKMAQSALGMAYARTYDLPVVVLRCSNLYGDAPCHGPRHGWLTWFCISAALGWPIEMQGTGLQTRDMLFSDDVARAVFASIDNIDKVKGNVYNIGGGIHNSISIREAIAKLITPNPNLTVVEGPGRKNEDMIFITNFSKFREVTKWSPQINVNIGINRIYHWASENKEKLDELYRDYR